LVWQEAIDPMLTLYDDPDSGNGYKPRLLLSLLEVPYDLVEVNAIQGETRQKAFLKKNPNGRIPLLELEDGTLLPESNAILFYLAEGSRYLPEDRLGRAQALQWMFFEQYSHEPYIAVLRYWTFAGRLSEHTEAEIAAKRAGGLHALDVMEQHLHGREWFVGERFGVADIALFAYTHVAGEGGFDLGPWEQIVYGEFDGRRRKRALVKIIGE